MKEFRRAKIPPFRAANVISIASREIDSQAVRRRVPKRTDSQCHGAIYFRSRARALRKEPGMSGTDFASLIADKVAIGARQGLDQICSACPSCCLFVGSRQRGTHDALSDVTWERPRLSRRHVDAHASQNGARSQFLRLLIGHFMKQEKRFLTYLLYR